MKKAVIFIFLVFPVFFLTSCPGKTYHLYIGKFADYTVEEYDFNNFKEIYNNQGNTATCYDFMLTDGPNKRENAVGFVREKGIVTWTFNYDDKEFEVTNKGLMTSEDGLACFEGRLKDGVESTNLTVHVSFKKWSTEKVIKIHRAKTQNTN